MIRDIFISCSWRGFFYFLVPWMLVDIIYIYIYIYIYISFYIYLITWKLICDHRFHIVLLRQSSGREKRVIGEIEKIEKYSQKNIRYSYNYIVLYNSSITNIENSQWDLMAMMLMMIYMYILLQYKIGLLSIEIINLSKYLYLMLL